MAKNWSIEGGKCMTCGAWCAVTSNAAKQQWRKGRMYCDDRCMNTYKSQRISLAQAGRPRQWAADRMSGHKNPMRDPVAKAKAATTLRAIGWRPPVRGGNGTGPTAPQLLLASALGWPMEVPIATGMASGTGHPTSYKADIAHPVLKVAIEVDGNSHRALLCKQRDAKAEAVLRGIGWTVLRFWNAEVMADLAACVQTVLSTISKSKDCTPIRPMGS